MKKSQLAINSVSTIRAGLEECLAAYRAAGFQNVEFRLGQVRDYLAGGHTPDEVGRLLEAHSLHCIGGFDTVLEAFTPADRQAENQARIVENARLLAELGGTMLVIGTDGPEDPKAVQDPLGDLARAFAEVADQIQDSGVNLCIEFNWSPLVKSLRSAAEIARRANRDNVGVLFDPAHYHCTPTKFDQLNSANIPYIKHVHVDDMRDLPGELSDCNSDRVLPGQGCLDLPALFGQLEKYGYRGYFSIELFNEALWAKPAHEAARLMYQSLLPLCED